MATRGVVSVTARRRDSKRDLMKAIVQGRFGPPDVLQLVDTDLPEVGADDVMVRVQAAEPLPTGLTIAEVPIERHPRFPD
jgi:NADPH:quinone reductase-like Zn-dependent oxidoreductase